MLLPSLGILMLEDSSTLLFRQSNFTVYCMSFDISLSFKLSVTSRETKNFSYFKSEYDDSISLPLQNSFMIKECGYVIL